MPVSRDSLRGLELDWLATDGCGHAGIFSTAGYGEIPTPVLEAMPQLDPMPAFEQLIDVIPERGSCAAEGRGPGACQEWIDLAKRGFFVYDWRRWDGPYERIVVPENPIRYADIPAETRARFIAVELAGCFAEKSSFDDHAPNCRR